MKIVVCSDSHGDFGTLVEVMEHNLDADWFFFLGDGIDEFRQLKSLYHNHSLVNVSGNCDNSTSPTEQIVLAKDVRFFLTHGHEYRVKAGLHRLFEQGKQRRADVVLYGHTHQAEITWRDEILYFCPGSITKSPHGRPSYGTLTIKGKEILPQIVWL